MSWLLNSPRATRVMQLTSYTVLILAFGVLAVVGYWLLYPYQTPSLKEPVPILNENNEIAPGEAIVLEVSVHKPVDFKPEGETFIICEDGSLISLVSKVTNMPTGDYTAIVDKYRLPEMPTDSEGQSCTLTIQNRYELNPIRSETLRWESEEFRVVRRVAP